MGFFENLGRKVERFKQDVEDAADDEADFVCTACGAKLFAEADACPECGSEAVERIRAAPEEAGDPPENVDSTEDSATRRDGDSPENGSGE